MAEYIVEVDAQGKVNLPLEIRKQLQVEEGDNLIFRAKEGKVEVEKLPMGIDDFKESLTMVGIVEI
ncbi:MAG TPA: AbrB/MazE/SpoVT family DNA-binding domain-containing protein [Firmicutes bacterium]|nr:AbrB/MazE/SpoVT family DNA-binding domain-containing protein [Bacillota bacterium]